MKVFVTGGAGYIGSHTVLQLLKEGHDVVVIDNLSNSSEESLARVAKLSGREAKLYVGDILDMDMLEKICSENSFDCCIHFAGLKAVGESVAKPWEYYNNNITGTLNLLKVLRDHNMKNFIFSLFGAPRNPLSSASSRNGRPPYQYQS